MEFLTGTDIERYHAGEQSRSVEIAALIRLAGEFGSIVRLCRRAEPESAVNWKPDAVEE